MRLQARNQNAQHQRPLHQVSGHKQQNKSICILPCPHGTKVRGVWVCRVARTNSRSSRVTSRRRASISFRRKLRARLKHSMSAMLHAYTEALSRVRRRSIRSSFRRSLGLRALVVCHPLSRNFSALLCCIFLASTSCRERLLARRRRITIAMLLVCSEALSRARKPCPELRG
jgi:hypothetical protein